MNQSNPKGKGVGLIISAISSVILAVILFTVASDKEELRYYFDEDYRLLMKIYNAGGWIFAVSAVVEFVAGLVLIVNGQNEEEWANSNLVTCPDCHKSISRQAETCPHCGRKSIVKSSSASSDSPPASSQHVPTWKRIQMMEEGKAGEQEKCVFCCVTLTEGQSFCSGCGRRRD